MALNRINSYNWEKVLAKLPTAEAKRPTLLFRQEVNQVVAESAKFGAKPNPIDFSAYKKKLKFTSATVDKLEAIYNKRPSPGFYAKVPDFIVARRQVTVQIFERVVEAHKADIVELEGQLAELENFKITDETTIGQLQDRFPDVARQIEQGIKNHEWAGVKN